MIKLYFSKQEKKDLINHIRETNPNNEGQCFDLAIHLEQVSNRLKIKIIQEKDGG
ncbi:hypothetical protein [uncultured Methanobrevibacter sp.]|uniref:hypothetical protein n=1 Tax=uncultured Methanobrevibacter sp. TaxID=253161 RepID=UPI00262A8DCB|nr:hypothetical protein [uncultured Methanobrevibacter sp.]